MQYNCSNILDIQILITGRGLDDLGLLPYSLADRGSHLTDRNRCWCRGVFRFICCPACMQTFCSSVAGGVGNVMNYS